ncbi:biotin-dependent carboxyltransferase family protein [Bradyrhizobium manausense]|uniref:5-oxoprolinase subunit C family protein n=1 Tax=Bradyrhizobium TaxID=374 RepID=UPI001BAA1748|nr:MULTISPECIES: biotin-dependent carboxyltransferase family protein [Bradyrhizobium]MBR0825538.1 biotin-dependent carboxyltransferase family protein [Bradyrhizobium manausense]UVO31498.1 biotin-dependent carboxyltransferase family protein [Bradyrhizobium arachidis]
MIEILTSHAFNTVQDHGRRGARHLGVSMSGAMDPVALEAGNALLANDRDAAGIEIQTFPFRLRFLSDTAFALTGADHESTLAGSSVRPWWCTRAKAGDILAIETPRRGARVYATFGGGIDVPRVLGSRSTHLRAGFGGFDGRTLQAGDVVPIGSTQGKSDGRFDFGVAPPDVAIAGAASAEDRVLRIRVMRAGEYDLFSEAMQTTFWSTTWKISARSDRGGYRLTGGNLTLDAPVEMRSHGVVAGVVQVPPAGEPIIQMSDANTAGGYPKMAAVIEADLWRLGQAPPGSFIAFSEVSYQAAVAAMAPVNDYLAKLRATADLYRAL